jgi:hypothetical protein
MIVVHFMQAWGITKSGRLPNCTYSRMIVVQAGRQKESQNQADCPTVLTAE